MKTNVDRDIIKYLKKRPQGAILQNMIEDIGYHRFTIQKALYRLMIRGLVDEHIYSSNCKVYRYK